MPQILLTVDAKNLSTTSIIQAANGLNALGVKADEVTRQLASVQAALDRIGGTAFSATGLTDMAKAAESINTQMNLAAGAAKRFGGVLEGLAGKGSVIFTPIIEGLGKVDAAFADSELTYTMYFDGLVKQAVTAAAAMKTAMAGAFGTPGTPGAPGSGGGGKSTWTVANQDRLDAMNGRTRADALDLRDTSIVAKETEAQNKQALWQGATSSRQRQAQEAQDAATAARDARLAPKQNLSEVLNANQAYALSGMSMEARQAANARLQQLYALGVPSTLQATGVMAAARDAERGLAPEVAKGLGWGARLPFASFDQSGGARVGAGGLAGALNPSMVGGAAGMAVIGTYAVAAYVGYKSIKDYLEFQRTEAQVAAQTNTPMAEMGQIGAQALATARANKSFYNPNTVLQGALLPLSIGLPAAVVKQLMPEVQSASQIIQAPDLQTIGKAMVSMVGGMGKDPKTSGANTPAETVKGYLNQVVRAEQMIPAPPGELTLSIPTLFASARGTGIKPEELLAAEVQLSRAGVAPQQAATWIGQIIRSSVLRPTSSSVKEAAALGIDLSAKGMTAAGGFLNYLKEIEQKTGGDPTLLAGLLRGGGTGGINAFRGFQAIVANGAIGTTMDQATKLTTAATAGTLDAATTTLEKSQSLQWTELKNHLDSDLISLGQTISSTVIPDLITFAGALVTAADWSGGILGGIGAHIDAASRWARMDQQFGKMGNAVGDAFSATGSTFRNISGWGGDQFTALEQQAAASASLTDQNNAQSDRMRAYQAAHAKVETTASDIAAENAYVAAHGGPRLRGTIAGNTWLTDANLPSTPKGDFFTPNADRPFAAHGLVMAQQKALLAETGEAGLKASQKRFDLANATTANDLAFGASPAKQTADIMKEYQAQIQLAQRTLFQSEAWNKPGASRDPRAYASYLTDEAKAKATEQQGLGAVDARQGKDLQARIDLDKLTGNTGDMVKAQQALLNFEIAHKKELGLTDADIALLKAQTHQDQLSAANAGKWNLHPFFATNPGLGAFAAGPEAALARLGGGPDAQTSELRKLQQQVAYWQGMANTYLAQIRDNTKPQKPQTGHTINARGSYTAS